MSIATRTGDLGTTSLMYGRRVAKHHQRVETYGTVDELNAALGMARALATTAAVKASLLTIQQQLVPLMGELAVGTEDADRYARDKYPKLTGEMLTHLDEAIVTMEAAQGPPTGWALPGADPASAALDLARTVCRRAERLVTKLAETEQVDALGIRYLNRLSDFLWLLARASENQVG